MEAIIMNELFDTTRILDVFKSFIWDEPYIGYGTFELEFSMDSFIMAGIEIGYYVSIKESKRYMIIEKINIKTNAQEGDFVVLSGRSLESILTRRIIRYDMLSDGSLQTLCVRAFNANLFSPEDSNRALNKIVFRSSIDPRVLNENASIDVKAGEYLYDVIFDMCRSCHIGFRVLPDLNTRGGLYCELFSGTNRSYSQEVVPWVVFSPKYENLNNSEMIVDYTDYKNIIIVEYSYTEKTFIKIDEETNEPIYKEEEKTEVREYGNTAAKGSERREIFKKINVELEPVNKSVFGKPEDRFNIWRYYRWGPLYITDSGIEKYKKDMADWELKVNSAAPSRKKSQRLVKVENYDKLLAQGAPYMVLWTKEDVLEDEAAFESRKDKYWSDAEKTKPNEYDYYTYGWVVPPELAEEYNKEYNKAQAEINAEYQAAMDNAYAAMMSRVESDAYAALSPYLSLTSFNGEVDYKVNFHYGRDFFLGDIVQIVDKYGYQAETRMVSIVFSQDSDSGQMAVPTFESDEEATITI